MPPDTAPPNTNPQDPSDAIETRSIVSSITRAQSREHNADPIPVQDQPAVEWGNIQHTSTLSSLRVSTPDGNDPLRVATLSPPVGQFIINTILQMAGFAAAIAFGVFAVKSVSVGHDANRFAAQALDEAVIANKLAMLAVCLASVNQTEQTQNICSSIIAGAATLLPSAASNVNTLLPSPTTATSTTTSESSSTHTSTSSSTPTTAASSTSASGTALPSSAPGDGSGAGGGHASGLTVGQIIAIGIGCGVGALILILLVVFICLRKRSRSQNMEASAPWSAPEPALNAYVYSGAPESGASAVGSGVGSGLDEKRARKRVGAGRRFRELFMDSYVVTR
ncbi:MAG: hypothetical protein Q9160_003765 [Pyrenula sp. 1 TL-2023]